MCILKWMPDIRVLPMYELLNALTRKPNLFDSFDTAALWADPHVARQMLQLHLDNSSDLASRPFSQIEAFADWLNAHISMRSKAVLDLGCGPGLYAAQFQKHGATVTGIDISNHSLAYAKAQNIPNARFILGSYHDDILPQSDIVTLIYGDICAMPQSKRLALFQRIARCLNKGGQFVLDCFGPALLCGRKDELIIQANLDDGFWAKPPYYGFRQSFIYQSESTILDRYLIVEANRLRWVHNWLQCLTPPQLCAELESAGFQVGAPRDVITGAQWQDDNAMFCCIATPA